ncbi:MAG: HAD-IIIA family hydrolase [Flavobacteriales bacterium]|nr:HAD-IIIA family hydrolase [Flavobacteriales bacterium]
MLDWSIDENWTLFLDRDGVINERIMSGYVLDYNDFHFKKGALETFASLSSKFKYVFVVTNQQCVALEKITEEGLAQIHHQMQLDIEKVGGKITKVFAATEFKNQEPFMRKPSIGMGKMAKTLYPDIDFSKAIMVGDTNTDLIFGKKLGMKTVLIVTEEKVSVKADCEVASLADLNELI